MLAISNLPAVLRVPEDILNLVFDELSLRQLVRMSHVCRQLRVLARNHKTFREEAEISRDMGESALDFFLARLAQARLAASTLSVTVMPSGGLTVPRTRLTTMTDHIIPAIALSMALLNSLHIEVPLALSDAIFAVLRDQAAPALRSFTITNWNHNGNLVELPSDPFAHGAPQLESFRFGDGILFPEAPIDAFQTVRAVTVLAGCRIPRELGLRAFLDWFPRLRELHLPYMPVDSALQNVTERHIKRFRDVSLFTMHISLYTTILIRFGTGNPISLARTVHLDVLQGTEPVAPPPVLSDLLQFLAPKKTSDEMYCWFMGNQCAVFCLHADGSPFTRTINSRLPSVVWNSLCASVSLVALRIDAGSLNDFRDRTPQLPVLETLYIELLVHLPAPTRVTQRASCPRLRTVIIESRRDTTDPPRPPLTVSYPRVDSFLSASLTGIKWATVDVFLIGFKLFAPANARTQTAGISIISKSECALRNRHFARLLSRTL